LHQLDYILAHFGLAGAEKIFNDLGRTTKEQRADVSFMASDPFAQILLSDQVHAGILVRRFALNTRSAAPFDFGVLLAPGVANNQVLLRLKLARAVTFPAGALSQEAASANATGSTAYTLKKNGTAFATVNFAAGAAVGIWTQAADAVFAAGDLIEIDGPATADATLEGVRS
jgi:hypothetical protein